MHVGESVACPFAGCSISYSNSNAFKTHIHRNHREITQHNFVCDAHEGRIQASLRIDARSEESMDSEMQLATTCDSINIPVTSDFVEADYSKALALFYAKLQCKYFIPAATVQLKLTELQELTRYANINICQQIIDRHTNLSTELRSSLLNEFSNVDLFQTSCGSGSLQSVYKRREYLKKNMLYVAPVPVKLGNLKNKRGKQKHFYYVPIKESLCSLFSDKSVVEEYIHSLNINHNANELQDILDGSVYKNNQFFQSNPRSLQIILYCDAFEVVNPLGSAKSKHKILAVYYSLANFRPHNRSTVDHIQLVLLCNEKDFEKYGQNKIFQHLINDIKELEDQGICLPSFNHRIKGTLVVICADNLGAHDLGGFVKSFNSEYFCRYCLLSKTEFNGDDPSCIGERRTPMNYMEAALQASDDKPVNGILHSSCFNQLQHFNICLPGMPPCLAHDVFEGVLTYDFKLCLNYFIKKKWFTFDILNTRITNFKYKGYDASSVPTTVSVTADKLQGSASQNWCFARLLPIMIGRKIRDFDDPAWELISLLREIIELISCPKLSHKSIAYLEILLEEYITLRKETFPEVKLRPKHHYLRHYSQLIMYFGPPIRYWILRFESKHSFFKKTVRNFHNFINLCYTLSEQHQCLQAVLREGNLFKPDLQIPDNSICFLPDTYNETIQRAIDGFKLDSENSVVCNEITLRGIVYNNDQYIVIGKEDEQLILGKIKVIVIKCDCEVYFIVHKGLCRHMSQLHIYEQIETKDDIMQCIAERNLLDSCPVYGYSVGIFRQIYFALKHYV